MTTRNTPLPKAGRLAVAGLLLYHLACPAEVEPATSRADSSTAVSTEEWNRLSPEQLACHYQLEVVAPGIWRLRMGQPEKLTPLSYRNEPARAHEMEALPACPRLPIRASSIGFKTTGRSAVMELPLQPGERVYGLGMQLKLFDPLKGRRTIRVSDDPTTDLGDSHAPVPFYVSTLGYGVYVDSARYVSFYTGNLDPVREQQGHGTAVAAQTAGGQPAATSLAELYRPRELGRQVMTIDVPVAHGVDLYLIGGPDLRQAVQPYNLFCGGGCLPPLWGLGVWYRASTELGQAEVLGFLREFRERHVPCDVFGLEPGWQSHAYSCSFVWSKKYPDPDPLLAEAGAIFAGHHQKLLVSKGRAGFKLDECDNQPLSATPWSFPECSRFPSGLDGEQMHLLFGPLYQRTMLEPFRQRNQRTVGLVRASGALAAPLPYVLYSDAYDHRQYVRALVMDYPQDAINDRSAGLGDELTRVPGNL